jgi:hypothetical protein
MLAIVSCVQGLPESAIALQFVVCRMLSSMRNASMPMGITGIWWVTATPMACFLAPEIPPARVNTNFLFRRYTSTPPTPLVKGGARKVSVTGI